MKTKTAKTPKAEARMSVWDGMSPEQRRRWKSADRQDAKEAARRNLR